MERGKVEEILYALNYLAWLSHVFCGDIQISFMKIKYLQLNSKFFADWTSPL